MKLHIYNPDTDFALALAADGASRPYTPPKDVRQMRARLALLPALYADPGDAILLLDEPTAPPPETRSDAEAQPMEAAIEAAFMEKRLEIVSLAGLKAFAAKHPGLRPDPWGWNPTLRRQLMKHGLDPGLMPSEEQLEILRELSHRRLTIRFNRFLGDELKDMPEIEAVVPEELTQADGIERFVRLNPNGFLKAPWSSSGRGVMPVASCPPKIVRQWALGTVSRQGSVMAETGADRETDFASEWILENGKARFLGLSLFNTSGRARYKGNELLSQEEIRRRIGIPLEPVIDAQRRFLEAEVAPRWSGPAGIDMLKDTSGRIRPCIEVNLRRTMGHVSLILTNQQTLKQYR